MPGLPASVNQGSGWTFSGRYLVTLVKRWVAGIIPWLFAGIQ